MAGDLHICSRATAYVSSGLESSTRRISAEIGSLENVSSRRSHTSGRFPASRYAGTITVRSGSPGASAPVRQRPMAVRIRSAARPSPKCGAAKAPPESPGPTSAAGWPVGRRVDPYRGSSRAAGNRRRSARKRRSGLSARFGALAARSSLRSTRRKTGTPSASAPTETSEPKSPPVRTRHASGFSCESASTIPANSGTTRFDSGAVR